ncbi:MAG: ATP-binding protein [Desulfosarcina sp.]|nr:ATP-binding protein [Desulfobacterales bacterium]
MKADLNANDKAWIQELMRYPQLLEERLGFFEDTSSIIIPDDPIDRVVFQDRAKKAIRKIAHKRGHILMVGRPGTGKSMLAGMLQEVLDQSLGDYIRPQEAILAYPGRDRNHIRIAYEAPQQADRLIDALRLKIEATVDAGKRFSLSAQIKSVRRMKHVLMAATIVLVAAGFFFPPLLVGAGITGIGSIFLFLQENNHRAQEQIQRHNAPAATANLKHLYDMLPTVLYDPRQHRNLMARIAEPNARNMKGGFRHDPYQSGNLQTPPHQRVYLGAHATAPIIYIDELRTLIRIGYMPELLEIMQEKQYLLEGGQGTGSGAADRSENYLRAENIIVACCNHDTIEYLRTEGDGAFLSRIEDKGEIVHMESSVAESPVSIQQVVQYVKQEVTRIEDEFQSAWGEVIANEGMDSVRQRCEQIFGRRLPSDFQLVTRDFRREAVMEIIKELRSRASDGKLTTILRPINGIIKAAVFEAIFSNARKVAPQHVRIALQEHLSLEGSMHQEIAQHKKDLKKYIDSITDSIGYVVGLAVVQSKASGQMHGQPLPIHCLVDAGADRVIAGGKIGEIAKAAAQNVRASVRRVLQKTGAPYVGYEMHTEYIQAHGGVEGDSASAAIDVALVSDFIRRPVNEKFAITGSLTGDIILAVGGVTEKLRSVMDPLLGMDGACIPWQNKHDVEPLLINAKIEYVQSGNIPGIRIYRNADGQAPFDIFFCKTKWNVYRIMMELEQDDVEARMATRCRHDYQTLHDSGFHPAASRPAVSDIPTRHDAT